MSKDNCSTEEEVLLKAIKRALSSFRCQHSRDDRGDGMELTDLLSPGETVVEGLDELEGLADHLLAEIQVGAWVPISKDLPAMNEKAIAGLLQSKDVLVFDKWGRKWTARLERWEDEEELWWCQFGRDGYKFNLDDITHWRPLPADPVQE